jgi:hypothetical protein
MVIVYLLHSRYKFSKSIGEDEKTRTKIKVKNLFRDLLKSNQFLIKIDYYEKLFLIAILSCNFMNAQSNLFLASGNVGIGTTAPTKKLEVNGGNILWGTPGSAPPSFNTRSAGTKLVLYPAVGAGLADYAIGIDNYTLWQGVPINDTNHSHKFYGGTTPLMTIRGDGNTGICTVNPTNKLTVQAGI